MKSINSFIVVIYLVIFTGCNHRVQPQPNKIQVMRQNGHADDIILTTQIIRYNGSYYYVAEFFNQTGKNYFLVSIRKVSNFLYIS